MIRCLFVLVRFKFCVLPFIFTIFTGFMEYEFIRAGSAESVSDLESDYENQPKVDKGKGKATQAQVKQQMGYSSRLEEKQYNTSGNKDKFIQQEGLINNLS